MKKITKFLASITSVLMVAGSMAPMAACDNSSNVMRGDMKVTAYDGSKVTVEFYHTMGQALKGILVRYIDDFNKMYPNITVKEQFMGSYTELKDSISTMLSSGKAPSMAYCYPDHVAQYNKAKAVLPLDEHFTSDLTVKKKVTNADGSTSEVTEQFGYTQEQIDDFLPVYLEECSAFEDGKTYAIPLLKSTELLYYNKDYFEANNYTPPTTWEEMENLCKTILEKETAAGKKCVPLGYDSEANWFITMAEQCDSTYTSTKKGELFIFDNEKNRDFVEEFREWYKAGYVTIGSLNGGHTSKFFTATGDDMKSYMTIGSSGGSSYQNPEKTPDGEYPFAVGVAPIPQVDENDPKVISQGPSLCIFKKSNAQETAAAWLFSKYLSTKTEMLIEMSISNGYIPAIESALDNPIYANYLSKADGNAFLQATCVQATIDLRDSFFVSPAFYGSASARDEMEVLMKVCLAGEPKKGQSVTDFIKEKFEATQSKLKGRYDR